MQSTMGKLAIGTMLVGAVVLLVPATAMAQPHGHPHHPHPHHPHFHHGHPHGGGTSWASVGAGIAKAIAGSRSRGHYVTVTERVLVEPGHFECSTRQVLAEAGHFEEVTVPPTDKIIYDDKGKAQVITLPARTRQVWVPARYETQEYRFWVPARYETRTYRKYVR